MGHWHFHFVRAENSDAVRQWAELEGKSDTMRDDLYRQHAAHRTAKRPKLLRVMAISEVILDLFDALRYIRSR